QDTAEDSETDYLIKTAIHASDHGDYETVNKILREEIAIESLKTPAKIIAWHLARGLTEHEFGNRQTAAAEYLLAIQIGEVSQTAPETVATARFYLGIIRGVEYKAELKPESKDLALYAFARSTAAMPPGWLPPLGQEGCDVPQITQDVIAVHTMPEFQGMVGAPAPAHGRCRSSAHTG